MSLMEMTLAGSMMILLTVVVRALAIHRLPKGVFGAMWALAVLRLLIPFQVPSRLSVFGWFAAKGAAPKMAAVSVATGMAPVAQTAAVAQAPAVHGSVPAVPVELFVWLAGMALCALAFALAYVRGLRCFREACPEKRLDVRRWMNAHPLWRRVRVMRTDRVSAPLTYGLLRPVILLPKRLEAEGEELEMILCHEWMHIRRLDALWKLILVLTACVHWFNPLVWAMFILANRDIELGCDEQVLRMNRGDVRRAYAMALIRMEAEKSRPAPLCSHFAQNAIEERITSIMKMKKRNVLTLALAAMLVLATGAAFATSAPEEQRRAVTAVEEGDPTLTKEDYLEYFAKYEPYGLTFNAEEERLYYQGKRVRVFEDTYPAGEDGEQAGCVMQMPDGEVDVHAVRDLSGPIVRNADGSFDPSGILLGLEASTQEEFDARTEKFITGYWDSLNADDELEWWTAEDFAAWIEQERAELQALIGTEDRVWTPSEGWFSWDQAHVDAVIAEYEETLKFIQSGGRVSRTGWEDGNVLMVSPEGKVEYAQSHPEPIRDEAMGGTAEQAQNAQMTGVSEDSVAAQMQELPESTWLQPEQAADVSEDGLAAQPEEMPGTAAQSEGGTAAQPQAELASDGTLNPEMFAEYLPFGLSVKDNALYFQGQRVRSFSDLYQADFFRTVSCEHEDPEGTIRVRAVREGGKLTGLEIVP